MNNNPEYIVGQVLSDKNGTLYPIVQVAKDFVLVMISGGDTKEIRKKDLDEYTIKDFYSEQTLSKSEEKVDHPSHYNREGSMECIDEMFLIFGKEAVRHFCILNAWKYRYRANAKNGEEDMKKADWYIKKLKELDMPF